MLPKQERGMSSIQGDPELSPIQGYRHVYMGDEVLPIQEERTLTYTEKGGQLSIQGKTKLSLN